MKSEIEIELIGAEVDEVDEVDEIVEHLARAREMFIAMSPAPDDLSDFKWAIRNCQRIMALQVISQVVLAEYLENHPKTSEGGDGGQLPPPD